MKHLIALLPGAVLAAALQIASIGATVYPATALADPGDGTFCYDDGLCYDYSWTCDASGCKMKITRIYYNNRYLV